jgi:hypothetical protein
MAFSPEVLEARLPLAYNITTTTLTSDDNGPLTFAYNITIDDRVDSNGFGRDVYLTRFDSGTPLVKVADNPSFANATTLGIRVGRAQCTTFFVTSAGSQKSLFATSDPAPVDPNAIPITVFGNNARFNLADKTNPLLQGINPLGISGTASIDYTDPDGGTHFLSFTYEASSLPAYGGGQFSITQINPKGWTDAKLAVPTGNVFTSYSPLTGDYVTSVSFRFPTSSDSFGTLDNIDVTNASYEYFDPSPANPQSFTVSQGQDLDQRLIVDLAPVGSRISVNSSWFGKLGDNEGDKPGINVDPTFYRAYDGVLGVGQLALYASEVTINQDVSSVNRIAIGGPSNVITRSGDLDPSSLTPNVVTNVSSVANLYGGGGLFVTGPGIQPDTTVVEVDSFTNSITLSKPPLSAQTNVSLKFIEPRPSGYIRETSSLRVLANAESPSFNIEVAGTQAAHGEIFVSQAGSLRGLNGAMAGALAVDAQSTDVRFEGDVSAASQAYFLSAQGSADQYEFTTRSSTTGTQTGLLSGDTVAFTLGQPGGGTVDLKTSVNNLRFDSGVSSSGVPFRYTVAIEDTNDLTVDSVAASSGPITLASATGKLSIKGSAVRTTGDLTVMAATSLSFDGAVSSSNGNVLLVSPTLTLGSSVTAGGARGVSLQSKTGPSTINALVQAGGQLKSPVRAATTAAVDLATGGLLTIDGVTLNAGDRVLVKNQSSATQNGIYVASAGTWVRASDASTSALLVPGFVTFAIEGQTQKGGWVFQNPTNPILGQTGTGLSFVPMTATLTYDPATAATTIPIDLTTNGLAVVDGVTLAEGDRVLVKNQVNQADNGIYLASVGPWVRASDADTPAELRAGSYVFITSGTTNGGQGFALLNDAVQVGTTDLGFGGFLVESQRSNFWSPSNTIGSVRVATTVNLEALAGLLTIDGVKLTAGDRVLVKNQITPSANGVYLAATGAWTRASDASLGTNFSYDTFVYVSEGTVGRGTGWLVDNSIVMTATLTADSNLLTGLRSTEGLTIGMAVEGEGIPAGSTITGVGADGTSVFLSQNAIATVTLALVRFASFTNPTVGVTPLVFRATGGNVGVASAGDISGSPTQGRLQGQNVVLTAGTGGTGLINTKTTASTISAVAPGSITLDNASQVELADIRSGTAADVVVLSAGTLTATSVAAGGNVSLSSTYGDVLAGRVGSTVGTITLSSLVSNTAIANATGTARVAAQNGSVVARADKGAVIVNGQVAAQGPGSDVSFISNYVSQTSSDPAAVRFGPLSDVAATDQLIIDTPNSMPAVDPAAKLTAARLSLRSKLFGNTAPPASLGSFPSVLINRTDDGDINYTSLSSLTVEGATTVNGSISFTAPDLKVTGGVATVGVNTDVTLTASTNNLLIDGTVASQRDVYLNAVGGSITNSAAGRTALITAPRNVTVAAMNTATLLTKAQALIATLTGVGSALDVQDDDGLMITSAVLSSAGSAIFKVGTPALGGSTAVGLIDVGPTGTVSIDSYGDIVENTADPTADIVAKTATFKSANGRIDLDTAVDVLTASTLQKTAPITLRDLGAGTTPLQLASLTGVGTGADITVMSGRTIQASTVTTAGRVNLTTTNPSASVQLGSVTATGNTATITSVGSIAKLTPASLITATSVVLDSASGSIDAMLAASNVAAATGAGGAISLQDADSLSIGNDLLARGISTTGPVSITVGGALTQSQSVVGQSLVATSTGDAITLTNVNNDVASLTVNNGNRAVAFTDVNALSIASIVGGPITLVVGGNLSQIGPITGTALAITGTAGTVSLTDASNSVDTLSVTNGTRNVAYTDKDSLTIAGTGVTGGNVVVTAGTGLTVSAPVNAGTAVGGDGDISLTSSAGSISLAANLNAKADRVTLDASNGTITQTAGIIDSTTLVWYAKSAPTLLNTNTFTVVGPHLTGVGNIRIPASGSASGTLTVAGASTFDGTITIDADAVVITDLVQAGGTAKSVDITARAAGGISFQSTGRIATNAGAITLSAANGGITASNTGTQTTVTGSSLSLTAQNSSAITSAVDSFSGTVSAGNLTLTESTGLALGTVSAQAITLAVGGNLTQTGALSGTSLAITASAGTVTLTNVGNDVNSLTVSNGTRDVTFTDKDDLSINGAGITGGNIVVTTGTNLTVSSAVTAGTTASGDGNIALTSTAGTISLAANLVAKADRVTLYASNGSIAQTAGTIDSQALVWYAQALPSPNPLAGTYSIVGPNLTAAGDLIIGPYATPITIAGASTVNGEILIVAPSVRIIDTVKTAAGNPVSVTATDGDIEFDGQLGGIVTAPAGAITLTATSGAVTAINKAGRTTVRGGPLTVNAQSADFKCSVQTLSSTVTSGGLTVSAVDGLSLGVINAAGQAVTLSAASGVTQQSGSAVTAQTLAVTNAAGNVTLTSSSNDVGSFLVSNPAGTVSYNDVSDLVLDGITAGATALTIGGALTQTAPITCTQLTITSTAAQTGAVLLDTSINDVESLLVSSPANTVSFVDANDLVINGITAGATTLTVGGKLSQTAPIACTQLTITSNAIQNGGVLLNTSTNDVESLSVSNPGRRVMFTEKNDLVINGITAGPTTLTVGGKLSQTNVPIACTQLTVISTAVQNGGVLLNTAANDVDSLAVSNPGRRVMFTDVDDLVVAGITADGITLTVGGNLTQTAPIAGRSLGITSTAGTINLRSSANNLDSLTVDNGGRLFSYADTSSVAITSVGTLSVGTVTAPQQLTVTTTNGGSVDVGPQANGLLQAGGTLDLRAVQGSIGMRNNGRIIGNPILLPPGKGIQVGGAITTPAELNAAISTINSLAPIPGGTYEILVASSMTLTQSLAVNRPITFRGTSQSIVLSGSSGVTNGLLLDSGASGSVIRDIAFSSFSGDAIRLTSATGITIKGIQANNSGNGLSINGTSTNTVVQGNTFDRNQTGVSLVSATGALVGGMNAGQGNVISSAVRQGVFASGFCTGSQVVKNTFPGTATPYNVSASRNLTIVN